MAEHPHEAPPAAEAIHMPGPTILPLINATGLTLAILGVTFHWSVLAFGLIIFLVTTVIWIRSTARDIDELPAEHHH